MRAMGIILAGGGNKHSKMGELAQKRAVAAMPVAGSYRSIDFSLSNMTNSHIQKVAVGVSECLLSVGGSRDVHVVETTLAHLLCHTFG